MVKAKVARPNASLVRTSVSSSVDKARVSEKQLEQTASSITFPKGVKGTEPLTSPPKGEKNGNVQLVAVLSRHGQPLMPCRPARARELLKSGRAVVVRRSNPF